MFDKKIKNPQKFTVFSKKYQLTDKGEIKWLENFKQTHMWDSSSFDKGKKMTSPFNDSELTQIDQPDDLNDSGFDGPWNQDFESMYYIPTHISL